MIRIRHITNSGLLLSGETWSLLIDAIFERMPFNPRIDKPNQRLPRTEHPSPEELKAMIDATPPFDHVTAYLISHLHPDHGNLDLIAQVADKTIPVYLPATERFADLIEKIPNNHVLLKNPVEKIRIGDVTITAILVKHDGSAFFAIEAYAFLIETPEGTVFFAGDSLTSDEGLRDLIVEFTKENKIDIAFLNYPELSREHGREFITNYLRPGHLFLSHMPAKTPGEDRSLGRLKHSLEKYHDIMPPITVCDGGELEY